MFKILNAIYVHHGCSGYTLTRSCRFFMQDLILAGTEEYFDHYMGIFTPVYITLTNILLRKVQYPEDSVYNSMSSEEKEQFRCYRQDIIDTVVSV